MMDMFVFNWTVIFPARTEKMPLRRDMRLISEVLASACLPFGHIAWGTDLAGTYARCNTHHRGALSLIEHRPMSRGWEYI